MSEEYKVGSLSDVIKKSSKAKKRKSSEGEIAKLASLFAAPAKRFEPEARIYNPHSLYTEHLISNLKI